MLLNSRKYTGSGIDEVFYLLRFAPEAATEILDVHSEDVLSKLRALSAQDWMMYVGLPVWENAPIDFALRVARQHAAIEAAASDNVGFRFGDFLISNPLYERIFQSDRKTASDFLDWLLTRMPAAIWAQGKLSDPYSALRAYAVWCWGNRHAANFMPLSPVLRDVAGRLLGSPRFGDLRALAAICPQPSRAR
jgi:hypothetical protein